MNEVSARLDRAPVKQPHIIQHHDGLDEMQALMALDPLLAGLHKQYLDAKASRLQARSEFGADDGMTEMAAMMEDSAWCSMQTRYMEVRADRRLREQANSMVEESRLEIEEAARKRRAEDTWRYVQAIQTMVRMREEDRRSAAGWWIILMMYFSQAIPLFRDTHATHRFNVLSAA